MKISENMKYTVLQKSVNKVSQQLNDLQIKISTQKTVNTPSDDPIKFATSVAYDNELNINSQFSTSLQKLKTLVSMYDTCFTSVSDQLTNLFQFAGTFDSMDEGLQESAVEQVKGVIEQLVTVANTKLGNAYIFGGQQADSAPFRLNNDYSVTYNVDATAEDATRVYVGKSQTALYGISGRAAFYSSSKIAYGSVGNQYTGDIYSNTDSFAYVIETGSNDTIRVDGVSLSPLTSGAYTGSGLAKEIASKLGSDYSVAFDSTTRKFVITNNTGSNVTLNWSTSNAASTLGFDNIDSVLASGETKTSDLDTGRKSFLVKIINNGFTIGATGSRAAYQYSIDGGTTWLGGATGITVSTGGADTTAEDITIDGTNDRFYVIENGTSRLIELDNDIYTGSVTDPASTLNDLAEEIQDKLGAGYLVSYNASTRKFSITNNTTGIVTFDWSNAGSTAAGVLGFDNVDSVVSSGASDTSEYDAGMFIDGSGVVNATNNRIKLAFGTGAMDLLTTADTFQVKDLSVFELLTNLKNAVEAGDTTWVSKNSQYLNDARTLITKSAAVVAFQGAQANTLIEDYTVKDTAIQNMQSNLVDADTSELGIELNVLMNTYQALLSAMSRVLTTNILDYLK
jgi:flagellin-like hook-associated protein FlgL